MVICKECNLEMAPGISCTTKQLTIHGKTYDRVVYTNDVRPEFHFCHDCDAPLGGLHHLGCDMERCPNCGGQLISCGCWTDSLADLVAPAEEEVVADQSPRGDSLLLPGEAEFISWITERKRQKDASDA